MKTPSAITLIVLNFLILNACATTQETKVEAQNNFTTTTSSALLTNELPTIRPSAIIADLQHQKAQNPDISPQELADFGNSLIKTKGLNFTFDWTPKSKENEENLQKVGENYLPFKYEFTEANGTKQEFQLMNNDFGHPCFSTINIPLTQVSEDSITVISIGKEIVLQRPKDFYLEEFALVDKSLKKVIRKWKTPIDATPLGISNDGTKVYLADDFTETENGEQIEDLAVEISANGALRFVPKNDAQIIKGKELKGYPKKSEISYKIFTAGKNEYIVKFSYPCT